MTLEQIARAWRQANPQGRPEEFMRVIKTLEPVMNTQALQAWRQVQPQLAIRREEEVERSHRAQETERGRALDTKVQLAEQHEARLSEQIKEQLSLHRDVLSHSTNKDERDFAYRAAQATLKTQQRLIKENTQAKLRALDLDAKASSVMVDPEEKPRLIKEAAGQIKELDKQREEIEREYKTEPSITHEPPAAERKSNAEVDNRADGGALETAKRKLNGLLTKSPREEIDYKGKRLRYKGSGDYDDRVNWEEIK
jgi:hypothetical protein